MTCTSSARVSRVTHSNENSLGHSMKQKRIAFLLLFLLAIAVHRASAQGAQNSLAEKLGFPHDAKLLIVHADDVGVTHSVNSATIKGLESGLVNSLSLMVPCPWFPEIADYAKSHPDADFGLHLTLTSERVYYRWGPVAPADKVPSLVDQSGYFHHDWEENEHVNAKEVEVELRAQIERARDGRSSHAPRFAPVPTHHERQGSVRRYAAGGSRVQVAGFRYQRLVR